MATGLAKNNAHIKRYGRLNAQLDNCMFQLNQAATTETLVGVMKEMTKIFKINQDNFDVKDIQKTVMSFQMEMEKQEMLQEQVQEAMDDDDDEDCDEEAEKIIKDIEFGIGGGGQ